MARDQESFNYQLYKLLKTRGYSPVPKDIKNKSSQPEEAAVFKFTFVKNGKQYGDAWTTIDKAHHLVLYYDNEQEDSPLTKTPGIDYNDTWTGLKRYLKNWAAARQMTFELKNKDELGDDMAQREHVHHKERMNETAMSEARVDDYKWIQNVYTPDKKTLVGEIYFHTPTGKFAIYHKATGKTETGFKDLTGAISALRLIRKIRGPEQMKMTAEEKQNKNSTDKLSEGYHSMGKKASYNDNIPSVKIILQHSRQIEEGEQRYRNIAKIFLENVDGERILAPTIRPGVAQVYARHIAEGGVPNDERWNHIKAMCEEYNKMAGFVRATKNNQFNESAQQLVNEGINHYQSLRETLGKLRGHKGYNMYFESWTPALMEDDADIQSINELFVQETLDPRIESVMPILSRLTKDKRPTPVKEVSELEEWANNVTKLDESYGSEHPAFNAILRRLTHQYPNVIAKHGIDKVEAAIQDQCDFIGDVEEIGSSDVSAWTRGVLRSLGENVPTSEDLDANQKRAGQLGPTEKVGKKGAVGKLVGVSESVEEGTDEHAVIMDLIKGNLDAYDVMNHPKSGPQQKVASMLQRMYDDISTEYKLYDDDFERIFEILMTRLADEYDPGGYTVHEDKNKQEYAACSVCDGDGADTAGNVCDACMGTGEDDSEEVTEDEDEEFYDGDKVKLKEPYADPRNPNEVYTVSQCDPSRSRCWIGDKDGFGWYARFSQLEKVYDDEDDDEYDDDLSEGISADDYSVTVERNDKGYRPKIINKKTGSLMYLSQVVYNNEIQARQHAKAYLNGYEKGGDTVANREAFAFAKANKEHVVSGLSEGDGGTRWKVWFSAEPKSRDDDYPSTPYDDSTIVTASSAEEAIAKVEKQKYPDVRWGFRAKKVEDVKESNTELDIIKKLLK